MPDDVLLNKIATIERCLGRVHEEYTGHEREFARDLTRQDSIILNLQRACEASIDLAMHWIRRWNNTTLALLKAKAKASVYTYSAGTRHMTPGSL